MDTLEFIKDISWQVVILFGLIVIWVYREPFGSLISNLRKGSYSSKKGEGVSVALEVEHPNLLPLGTDSISVTTMEQQVSENIVQTETLIAVKEDQKEVYKNWYELYLQGDYKESREALLETIKKLEQAGELNDDYLLWLKGKAAIILSKFDYAKGKDELEILVKNYPDDLIGLYIEYIEILYTSGDSDRVNSLIENYSGNKSNKYALLFEKAQFLQKGLEIDKAIVILDELNSQNDNLLIKAKACITRGEILKTEKPDEAKNWFIRAYKIQPTNGLILESIAELLGEMNELKLALFFRKLHQELDSNNVSTWGYLGNAYLTLNMYSHSMDAYEKANELSSGSAQWIVSNIGNLHNNAKLYGKAIKFLNTAMTMDSSNEYAANRLASALSNNEKEEKEIQKLMNETRILISKNGSEQNNQLPSTTDQ